MKKWEGEEEGDGADGRRRRGPARVQQGVRRGPGGGKEGAGGGQERARGGPGAGQEGAKRVWSTFCLRVRVFDALFA